MLDMFLFTHTRKGCLKHVTHERKRQIILVFVPYHVPVFRAGMHLALVVKLAVSDGTENARFHKGCQLAPPASRLEDFQYQWKLIQFYYQNHDESNKEHIENTKIEHYLHQMLQLLVEEETENPDTVGPCLEKLIGRALPLLDGLCLIAGAERPAGARGVALAWCTSLLRRIKQPFINHAHVYRPIQRILIQCNENPASPTEKEEVELLLTLCGLVRKQPGLANIFTTPFVEEKTNLLHIPEDVLDAIPIRHKVQTPKKNKLFEFDAPRNPIKKVSIISRTTDAPASRKENTTDSNSFVGDDATSCRSQKTVYDDNDKFLLIDLLLTYLNSADNHIVLRACEGIMIVSSLPDDDIANLVTSCSSVCESLVDKLVCKYKSIPANIDPCDVDHLNITWGYVVQDFGDKYINKFPGYRELTSFLSWLDYCDTLVKECHPSIASHLARTFRQNFLEATVEGGLADLHHMVLVTAIISKCLKVIDSPEFINEISNWLVGDGEIPEWPLLHTLISNCLTDNHELTLETLRFFEAIIEKPTEHSLQRLVLCQMASRGYFCPSAPIGDEDERDRLNAVSLQRERDSNRQAMKQLIHEGHVSDQITDLLCHEGVGKTENSIASDNIHKIINSFLLLLPKAILSDPVGTDYEQYIHDAHRHYQAWLDITSTFHWPVEPVYIDNTASSTHSYDSRPEADLDHHSDLTVLALKDDDVFEPKTLERKSENDTEFHTVKKSSAENVKFRKISQDSPFLFTQKFKCCTEKDIEMNKIGKCGKPASQCPFSQALVLRNRDLSSKSQEEEIFDEGPFLKMLFKLLSSMPNQPYQINLALTSIISKLAMLPHPNLHEYLLNPMLPTAKNTKTPFKVLQELAWKLTLDIPKVRNYATIIENTRRQLLDEHHKHDESHEHNQLFESLIVVEEFCKELAAIAFVKYQHQIHADR